MDVGERGMSAALLAKHVYNQNCTFFFQPDLHEIRRHVWLYLKRNSRSPKSLFQPTGRRGYYRLNTKGSAEARRLVLSLREKKPAEEPIADKPAQDLSLSLFGEEC